MLVNSRTEAACATTNSDGTCASCASNATEYGPQCLECPCAAAAGTCDNGVTGSGRCTACESRRFGVYCERSGWKSSLLLDWIQFNVGIVSAAMAIMVMWVYYRVFTAVRAERRYLLSNSDRIQQFASASRVAYSMAALEKKRREDGIARADAALPERAPKEVNDDKPTSANGSDDEPVHFFGDDAEVHDPSIYYDDNDVAVVNVRSPQPKEQQRRTDPFEDVPSARLFASNSRSRSYDPTMASRAPYRQSQFGTADFGSPFPRHYNSLRQAPSLDYDHPNGLEGRGTLAVSRGCGPGGMATSQLRRSTSYDQPSDFDTSFRRTSESHVTEHPPANTGSPSSSSLRPIRSSQRQGILSEQFARSPQSQNVELQNSGPTSLLGAIDRPLGMTTKELLRSPSPLPRFRPGDRVRRNARHVAALCDFGGDVGDVLCGECVTIETIIVKRDLDKGVSYSFTARGGDQEPPVPFALEDLFDVASNNSSSNESF
jgi:hypothetical protein